MDLRSRSLVAAAPPAKQGSLIAMRIIDRPFVVFVIGMLAGSAVAHFLSFVGALKYWVLYQQLEIATADWLLPLIFGLAALIGTHYKLTISKRR